MGMISLESQHNVETNEWRKTINKKDDLRIFFVIVRYKSNHKTKPPPPDITPMKKCEHELPIIRYWYFDLRPH
jgi:hypothetical protein